MKKLRINYQSLIISCFLGFCLILFGGMAIALVISTVTMNTVGNLEGSGVVLDKTSLSWGSLGPHDISIQSVTITNQSPNPETLTFTTTGKYSYLDLTWNVESVILQPSSSVEALFTLQVNTDNPQIGQFEFDITVIGTEI